MLVVHLTPHLNPIRFFVVPKIERGQNFLSTVKVSTKEIFYKDRMKMLAEHFEK